MTEEKWTYKIASPFSNGTEYEIFKDNYCEECIHHKIRKDGFCEFIEDGGCPIENGIEDALFDVSRFPNVLLQVWQGKKCLSWNYCPFCKKKGEKK
jgi:hypothetical protein